MTTIMNIIMTVCYMIMNDNNDVYLDNDYNNNDYNENTGAA